jgi:hypothetical protein
MPAKMHMTVPKGFRKNQEMPEVLVLHHANLIEDEIETRHGYRVTTPLRTFSDIIAAETVAIDQIVRGIHEALKRGLISKRQIYGNQERYSQLIIFFKDHIDERPI